MICDDASNYEEYVKANAINQCIEADDGTTALKELESSKVDLIIRIGTCRR
jgi:hypothetical protein